MGQNMSTLYEWGFLLSIPAGFVLLVNIVTPRGLSKDCDFVVKRRIFVSVLFGALGRFFSRTSGGRSEK